jgi:hypothetical protein
MIVPISFRFVTESITIYDTNESGQRNFITHRSGELSSPLRADGRAPPILLYNVYRRLFPRE